jgi:hypothetical protein
MVLSAVAVGGQGKYVICSGIETQLVVKMGTCTTVECMYLLYEDMRWVNEPRRRWTRLDVRRCTTKRRSQEPGGSGIVTHLIMKLCRIYGDMSQCSGTPRTPLPAPGCRSDYLDTGETANASPAWGSHVKSFGMIDSEKRPHRGEKTPLKARQRTHPSKSDNANWAVQSCRNELR